LTRDDGSRDLLRAPQDPGPRVTINDRLDAPSPPEHTEPPAVGLTSTVPPTEAPAENTETPAASPLPRSRRDSWKSLAWSTIPWLRVGAWLGVLLPLLLLIKVAIVSAPSFDGSMNLQAALNFTQGHGFSRHYITGLGGGYVDPKAGTSLFPLDIQTSGPYLFVAAGSIELFGSNTFAFQLPNLLFLFMLLGTVSLALRRWPVLRIVGPSIALFAVPGMMANSMGGYGEFVVAALAIASFALLGAAAAGARRPLLYAVGASVLFGAAMETKIVAAIEIPVLLLGFVGLLLARRDIKWWKLLLASFTAAIPVVLIEIQRLVSLGSLARWKDYWHLQRVGASSQAGVTTADASYIPPDKAHGLKKIADHFHLLSTQTHINSALLVIVVVLPFVALVGLFLYRRTSWRDWLAKPGALLAIQLAAYSGLYIVWWLAVTPTAKTWLRRIVIGLAALVVLYLVLLGMAKDRYQERATLLGPAAPRRALVARVVWGLVAVLAVVTVIPAVTTFKRESTAAFDANAVTRDRITALAAAAKKLEGPGVVLYGTNFLSAPQIALYGDLPLRNLNRLDGITTNPPVCDPATGIPSGNAYLIWDLFSAQKADVTRKTPYSLTNKYTPLPQGSSPFGTIYKITLINKKVLCGSKS
jgi:hypothetical protein